MNDKVFCLKHTMLTEVVWLDSDTCMNRWMASKVGVPRGYSVMFLTDNTMYSKANSSMVILW